MVAYFRPTSLDDALGILAQTPATIAAGCTDLFPATQRPTLAGPVLDITAIAALRGVQKTPQGWRIGATTTWTDVIRADLPTAFDMLKQAAHEVGSVQIQNVGTVAGNLCNASPAADGVPPLLALDARAELSSKAGIRQMPLAQFLTDVRRTVLQPGEILTALHIPEHAGRGHSRFLKLGARRYLVISISMVAARLVVTEGHVRDAALSVGACSAVATRLDALEQALVGLPLDRVAEAVRPDMVQPALHPISDIRADAGYRANAAVVLLGRVLGDLAGDMA